MNLKNWKRKIMPTYLYKCDQENCVGEFEEYHSIVIKLEECPHCLAAGRGNQPIERLIHGGGSGRGIVELTGRDYIDSVQKDAQRIKKEVYSNENSYANVLGTDKYQALQQKIDKQRR